MSRASDRDRVWQALVALVFDRRDDWRRAIGETTGLPFSRYRALKRIGPKPLTLRALAEAMGTDAPATTVIVNDLEARGLVVREAHPEDRRAKLVSLTPEGKRVVRVARGIVERVPPEIDALDAKDLAELARIVDKMRPT